MIFRMSSNWAIGLDGSAALFAMVAAVFWFLSAVKKLPPVGSPYGKRPEPDPFFEALNFTALLNKRAAFFSGLSALCMATKLCIQLLAHPS